MSDEKQGYEQLVDAVKSLGSTIYAIGMVMVFALFMLVPRSCNCDSKSLFESQCKEDCAVRNRTPGHEMEEPRFHAEGECWCFDQKTGQSTQVW